MEIACHLLGSAPQACPALLSYPLPLTPAGRHDYDLLVIGGGSGGLACAKEGMCPVSHWCHQAFRVPWSSVVLQGWLGVCPERPPRSYLPARVTPEILSLCPAPHCTPVVYAAHSSQVGAPGLSLTSLVLAPGLTASPPTHGICLPPPTPSLTPLQPPASSLFCKCFPRSLWPCALPSWLPCLACSSPAGLAVGLTSLQSLLLRCCTENRTLPAHPVPITGSTVLVLSPGTVPKRSQFVVLALSHFPDRPGTQMGPGTQGRLVKRCAVNWLDPEAS